MWKLQSLESAGPREIRVLGVQVALGASMNGHGHLHGFHHDEDVAYECESSRGQLESFLDREHGDNQVSGSP